MHAQSQTSTPELLAPAGDWEALRAAVANGANAVYFGLPQFNARYRAANFTLDELPAVMRYLHDRGVKGYVAFNTLIFADEWPEVVAYLNQLRAAAVDAVIVQDWGLAWLIQQLYPDLVVHASTQTTQTEPRGIRLLSMLGIQRVILARELSLADIRTIAAQASMPVEVFVHGALCVSYSGQCLTSEALGGRSANRGHCAQACRMPYELHVDGVRRDLGDRAYLISPQDLAAPELVADLVASGVSSLKIEGRLKGGPYVAATTKLYRDALDAAIRGLPYRAPAGQMRDVEQTFSRGLFHGFLDGVNHQITTPARFPKHRGVRLGTVARREFPWLIVRMDHADGTLEEWIKPGDGLVFDEGRPEEEETGGRVFAVKEIASSQGGRWVRLQMDRHQVDPRNVEEGAIVWKTDDPAVRKRLEQTYAKDKPIQRVGLRIVVRGVSGAALSIAAATQDGRHAQAAWEGPLQPAKQHPADLHQLREHLGRLKETPFELIEVVSEIDDAVLIPPSVLNRLRRQLVAQLQKQTQVHAARPAAVSVETVDALRKQVLAVSEVGSTEPARLHVLARTLDQVKTLSEYQPRQGMPRPEQIYCDFEDVRRYRQAVAMARDHGLQIGLATLRVIKPGEETWLRLMAECEPDFILVRNLAALAYFRENTPHLPLVGDYSLNVVNEFSAAWLKSQGLARMVPGYDVNWHQLSALLQTAPSDWFEVVIHYFMPMFHMEHCVFAAFLSTGQDYRDCGRPCDRHRLDLSDHQQAHFPVIPDAGCRNTVYNSLPQSAAEFLPRMLQLGLRHFRLELLRESGDDIIRLWELYQEVLQGRDDGRNAWRKVRGLNQIGVTRGTLQLL